MNTFSRTCLAASLLAGAALAGPPLTTIQDVIYKADGTRFNGMVTISWSGFEAADSSAIATQMVTVKVVDGSLRVKLVPNTTSDPLVLYSVVYNSDGRVQFNENWAVPASTRALRLRDVRVATASGPDPRGAPIQEADVVGLIADLGARPVKGTTFVPGRVTVVNGLGTGLDSVVGNAADCVRVDGSSGPCGSPPSFVDGEAPSGIVDGANVSFTISGTPNPASSLGVYRNGLLQKLGLDYTVNNRVIQFLPASTPQPGDTLLASYRVGSSQSGAPLLFPGPEVVCSGTGATVNSASFASLGTCVIPPAVLTNGDRVEVRFDLEHQGVASGYAFEVRWGGTTILHRDANATDVLATGRVDAGLFAGRAQIGTQSWGSTLPFSATVASASDAFAGGLTIDFQGRMGQAGETLALRNYSVVRLP